MKLIHITIAVKDLEKSLAFYRDIVGLPVNRRFASGASEIAFVGEGDTEIELICGGADVVHSADVSIGFAVDSLTDTIAFLAENGIAVGDEAQPNPQVRFAFAHDPDGFRVQFVESAS